MTQLVSFTGHDRPQDARPKRRVASGHGFGAVQTPAVQFFSGLLSLLSSFHAGNWKAGLI